MTLRQFIYNHIKDSKKYRFVIYIKECDFKECDFINTSFNEISFYDLFQIVGVALLDYEVKEVRCNENRCKIEVE